MDKEGRESRDRGIRRQIQFGHNFTFKRKYGGVFYYWLEVTAIIPKEAAIKTVSHPQPNSYIER
jgi:hypothetical protein